MGQHCVEFKKMCRNGVELKEMGQHCGGLKKMV